jgi:ABC-type nitrate/sulfonate/bicarbonate transport system permease component
MSATERAAAARGARHRRWADRGQGGVSSERALSARPTAIAGRLSGWLLVLACLVLWEASARFGAIESTSWPPFTSVVSAALAGFASGELPRIVLSTLGRMVAGFAFGSAAGVAVGLLLGTLPVLSRALTPTLEGLRPLPIPAIVPPLILFLGLDDLLKITVVAIAVFFPVMVNTLGGVRNIDPVLLATARTFRLSRAGTLMAVVLPAALPSVMAGLRTALALALVTTIVAETSRRSDAMPSRRRAARSTSSRAMTTRPGSEPASRPSRIGKRRSVAPASTATS